MTVFAAGVLSTGNVYRGSFAPDGQTLYFFKKVGADSTEDYRIFRSRLIADRWSIPDTVRLGDAAHSDLYPSLSADGSRMVFSSYRPVPGDTAKMRNAYLWYVDRVGNGWGAPTHISTATLPGHYHAQPLLRRDGSLQFKRITADWRAEAQIMMRWNGSEYVDPQPFEPYTRWKSWRPDILVWEGTPDPAGSFVVLAVSARDSTGRPRPADLWMTLKRGEDWSEPQPLCAGVNSPGTENFPFFSPDAKTLYFVRDFREFYRIPVDAALCLRPSRNSRIP